MAFSKDGSKSASAISQLLEQSMRTSSSHCSLCVESLERREMLAVTSVDHYVDLSTGKGSVDIYVDGYGSKVHTFSAASKLVVKDENAGGFSLIVPTWEFPLSSVTAIEFHGGKGPDNFRNDALLPVIADGGAGDDYLEGANANDVLFGGSGRDTLVGFGGNDRLYGGDGIDTLKGMDGNDALYGGGLNDADQLWGGAGKDRFLTQYGDVIRDGSGILLRSGEDAQLRFLNQDASWSNREIEIIDEAFARLFAARGDNRLLKETQGTAPLAFYQTLFASPSEKDYVGLNTEYSYVRGCSGPWYAPNQSCDFRTRFESRTIRIKEWDESSRFRGDSIDTVMTQWDDGLNSKGNRDVLKTLIHEIGHNYEDDGVSHSVWRDFQRLSGWVKSPASKAGLFRGRDMSSGTFDTQGWYRSTNNIANFAGGYGATNPFEDWATCWELYFRQGRSTVAPAAKSAVLGAKLKLIEQMVRAA